MVAFAFDGLVVLAKSSYDVRCFAKYSTLVVIPTLQQLYKKHIALHMTSNYVCEHLGILNRS